MHAFHFTTVVSSFYLYKFLAMQDSILKYCKNYHLFALCVDPTAYKILKRLPLDNITLISVNDIENEELLRAKQNRIFHEYCWTLKPFLLNFAMKTSNNARYFVHLDSDLFFFSGVEQIINEAPHASLFLTDHNNSDGFLHTYETSGRFNTGFVCCKNDETANKAVEWWLARCLEKCPVTADAGIFGDQKYVEKWPDLFPDVHIVNTKGANVAQWNIEGLNINLRDEKVYVNNDRLIFYHFSGLSILNRREYNLSTFSRINEDPLNMIYTPYIKNLSRQIAAIKKYFPGFTDGYADKRYTSDLHIVNL